MCEEPEYDELKDRIMSTVSKTLKKRRLYRAISLFLRDMAKQEREYYQAIQDGAVEIELSPEVEMTGDVMWKCKCQLTKADKQAERIVLNFEYTIWMCPECGRCFAFRIQQPEEVE